MNPILATRIRTASFSLFDIEETASHYLVSLNITDAIGEEVSVELTNEELVIRDRGGLSPEKGRGNLKNVTLKSDASGYALAAYYRNGMLFIALPKKQSEDELGSREMNLEARTSTRRAAY
jgi:HSP20 family molecular chaperone IbpA